MNEILPPRIRPSFEDIFMAFAQLLSERSTCRRASVGCVIASLDFRQVYSVGYNGNARGGPNDCDRIGEQAIGNCGCIHAEANAVVNCTTSRESTKIVLVTTLPCVACAKMMINMGGVVRVIYKTAYRSTESIEWLKRADIEVEHHSRSCFEFEPSP